jgi:hypothetical protein
VAVASCSLRCTSGISKTLLGFIFSFAAYGKNNYHNISVMRDPIQGT